MIPQHVLVGSLVIVLCLVFLFQERWILEKTAKGQRLVRWFGPAAAPWAFRGLMLFGAVFGGLLATGLIRPIQW